MAIANSSGLGSFILGAAKLGTAPKQMLIFDSLGLADSIALDVKIPIAESLGIADSIAISYGMEVAESLGIVDSGSYASDYNAGITARITVILDIQDTDWCEIVLEGGHTIGVNGVPARAFVFVKQSGQRFDHGIGIQPGDAVMFTCPAEPVIIVTDIVTHNNLTYEIIDIIDHEWNGNLIYRKAALRKIVGGDNTLASDLPQVIGLAASPNLEGKTTLTWDAIPRTTYPEFDYYEIWESLTSKGTDETITAFPGLPGPGTVTVDLSGAYVAGKFTPGGIIQIYDSAGNNGFYAVVTYVDNGGLGRLGITMAVAQDLTTPLGTVLNLTKAYVRETTRSNSKTIKNLTANTIYYYLVRGIDKYGKGGPFSAEAATGVDTTKPAQPKGVR